MSNMNDAFRKRLNVDSPSFTPLQPSNGLAPPAGRTTTISPKAASAAVFTPNSNIGSTPAAQQIPQQRESQAEWNPPAEFTDFIPQSFDMSNMQDSQSQQPMLATFDPFSVANAVPGISNGNQQAPINPYAQEAQGLSSTHFYQSGGGFTQPLQYHLYAPSGPTRENLFDYQRTAYDFFIPEDLREDLHRKSEATRQTLPQLGLPSQVDVFHSLVPLDTNHQKNTTVFGYNSWVYKAISSKDGNAYALRRLEGYKLTDERAIRSVRAWNRVRNGGVVSLHSAITTRAFGDSSLVFVTDYHPLSKTLTEQYIQAQRYSNARAAPRTIPENELWSYIVQIASALQSIHSNGLAARVLSPSKILITSKNRLRLNACGILDVVKQHETHTNVADLQQQDLIQFGQVILALTTHTIPPHQNIPKAIETLARFYSPRLRDCVNWLLTPSALLNTPISPTSPTPPQQQHQQMTKSIDIFLAEIAGQVTSVLDSTFHAEDTLVSHLTRELENGRIIRLMTKLNMINERPDFFEQSQWSETGERYFLKLFRDFVFHQVDAQGRPTMDLAHVIGALNKLDAGSEEKIVLMSRDEQNVLVVTYREVKRGLDAAWQELLKAGAARRS